MTTSLSYRYVTFHPLTHERLSDYLPISGPQWSEIIDGDGSFTGKIVIPESMDEIASIRAATIPLESALYVVNGDGDFVWGGIILERNWSPKDTTIELQAVEWRTWLNWRFLSPEDLEEPNDTTSYEWEQEDQLFIARDLLFRATNDGSSSAGCPEFFYGDDSSGPSPIPAAARRDLDVKSYDFRTVASVLNEMAHRNGGFEWTVVVEQDPAVTTSLKPRLRFVTYYPQRGSSASTTIFRHSGATVGTGNAGNILDYGNVGESGRDVRQRIWGQGSSDQGTPLVAVDSEPLLDTGLVLLSEDTWSNSTITNGTTLANNARQERLFRKPGLNTLQIVVSLSNPDVGSYDIGDRARLMIKDRWLNIDLASVRIIEKIVSPGQDSGQAVLTLDLTDLTPPETDTGGTF